MMEKNNHSKNMPQPLYNWIGTILSILVIVVGVTVYFTNIRNDIGKLDDKFEELELRIGKYADEVETIKSSSSSLRIEPREISSGTGQPGPLMSFTNAGPWGEWSDAVYCGEGQYVCGLQQKVEGNQGPNRDDSAMNAVGFFCCSLP